MVSERGAQPTSAERGVASISIVVSLRWSVGCYADVLFRPLLGTDIWERLVRPLERQPWGRDCWEITASSRTKRRVLCPRRVTPRLGMHAPAAHAYPLGGWRCPHHRSGSRAGGGRRRGARTGDAGSWSRLSRLPWQCRPWSGRFPV